MAKHDSKNYRIDVENIGIPHFPEADLTIKQPRPYTLFDLSSHARAREAICFGLKLRESGFHVFVVGEDRSGRMTATLGYLNDYIKNLPPPSDWVYLNNFKQQHKPLPFELPNGTGIKLTKAIKEHVKNLETVIKKTFTSPSYLKQIDKISSQLEQQTNEDLLRIKVFAENYGLEVLHTPEGFHIQEKEELDTPDTLPTKAVTLKKRESQLSQVKDQLNRLTLSVSLASRQVIRQIKVLQETLVRNVTRSLWQKLRHDYAIYLGHWVDDFEDDVLENIDLFLEEEDEQSPQHYERYTVNLFIDNQRYKHPRVFLESMPTQENLFGAIKNRVSQMGSYETNFTMIRPGSLHKANGGILVIRAETLAKEPDVWEHLKATLRDKQIRIEDRHREHMSSPLIDAPAPRPIPLDIQVFIVGQPAWYYSFFFSDPEFRIYFKVKADIDPDLDINDTNTRIYGCLIKQTAEEMNKAHITPEAIHYLTQCSARWAGNREKLSGRFELIGDVLAESLAFAREEIIHSQSTFHKKDIKKTTNKKNNNDNDNDTTHGESKRITIEKSHVRKTLIGRRIRNARIEDQAYAEILNGTILIDTQEDTALGQVNGLTVLSSGDHEFGLPARISARTYVGSRGIINIERLTDMGGPIQQKGAFILDGFLNSLFAQDFPLSFSCSLTFEQSYSDVEGDSASLAELCAILSSLSDIPLRQNLAITGSMNQFGIAQAVGGIHHKIEGFFEICKRRGFTGHQGVIVPTANKRHLTVKDEVVEAIRDNLFHIYAVSNIFEALDLLTGISSQITRGIWGIKRTGVLGKAYDKLKNFHAILNH